MVREGETAVVHFVGRVAEGEDAGEVFDTSDVDVALQEGTYHENRDYEPLEFEVGAGTVLEGLDAAVRGMVVGETKTVRLDPEEAFGEYSERRVGEVPRSELESGDREATPGALVRSETGAVGWVTEVTDGTATVDFNHELAGVPIELEVRLLQVRSDDE